MTWWERLGWHRGEMLTYLGCGVLLLVAVAAMALALVL